MSLSFPTTTPARGGDSAWRVFWIFLRLGCTSFGGPVAHLAYFRDEFVTRRQWLDEASYASLVALCQFLPGPASSQVGIALGLRRAGYAGALAAWTGFTLPSALLLTWFALSLSGTPWVSASTLHGLNIAATAIVVQAVWGMARQLCTDRTRLSLMGCTACAVVLWPSSWVQVACMVLAAWAGYLMLPAPQPAPAHAHSAESCPSVTRRAAFWAGGALVILLLGLPLILQLAPHPVLHQFEAFARTGSLVFGGGHVVLPLLQNAVVNTGWVSEPVFMAGYGATQAMPGPLFTFAAFLGASMQVGWTGWAGAAWCLVAVFVPAFLLVLVGLPFWERLKQYPAAQTALAGTNAAVVGLLLATLYQPMWAHSITQAADFAFLIVACMACMVWRCPAWLLVLGCAAVGTAVGAVQTLV